MHFVQVAAIRPQRCAVIPYVGATHPNGFIDTGNELDGNRIYISIVALAEMARLARIIPPAIPDVRPELEAAHARIKEIEAELQDRDEQLAAIDRLQRGGNFYKSKRPGAPKGTKRKKVEA